LVLERGQLIQKQDAMVRRGHLPRHGQLTATDQPYIRNRMLRRPTRAHGHARGAITGEAGEALGVGGFDGLRQHFLDPLAVEVLLVPLYVREELLQPLLTCARDRLGDRIAVLVGQFGKQPRHLSLQGRCPLQTPEAYLEGAQNLLELRQLGRARMHVQGYSPFAGQDTTSEQVLTKQY
jgi:hypothetical protein